MAAVFYGDRNTARAGSLLMTGVNNINNNRNDQLNTPPDDDYPFLDDPGTDVAPAAGGRAQVGYWLEVWDYVGGASFRGFIAEDNGEKSLFVFFDPGVLGRSLKKALMALITLTDSLGCAQTVIGISRAITDEQTKSLSKGLGWAGFTPTTLDFWTDGGIDVTSKAWLFMGLEV